MLWNSTLSAEVRIVNRKSGRVLPPRHATLYRYTSEEYALAMLGRLAKLEEKDIDKSACMKPFVIGVKSTFDKGGESDQIFLDLSRSENGIVCNGVTVSRARFSPRNFDFTNREEVEKVDSVLSTWRMFLTTCSSEKLVVAVKAVKENFDRIVKF